MGGGIGEAVGLLRALLFLIGVHGEDFEIAEIVDAIVAMFVTFPVKFGGLRQPKLQIVRVELNFAVFDGEALVAKLDFLDWPDQIGFQAQNLKSCRINPGASFEGHRIIVSGEFCNSGCDWRGPGAAQSEPMFNSFIVCTCLCSL